MSKRVLLSIIVVVIATFFLLYFHGISSLAVFTQNTYCNVDFKAPVYEFKDSSGNSVFVLDEAGNLYLSGKNLFLNHEGSIPSNGLALKVSSSYYWTFSEQNAYIKGNILQDQDLDISTDSQDIVFKNPLTQENLAIFDGSTGNLLLKGKGIIEDYQSNCTGIDGWYYGTDSGPGCLEKNDEPAEYLDYYCNISIGECLNNLDQTVDCNVYDGWYEGGNTVGCGDDPSSGYYDYFFDMTDFECKNTTENCDTFDCDSQDVCTGACNTGTQKITVKDVYAIHNTNTCATTWGSIIKTCNYCTDYDSENSGTSRPVTASYVTQYNACTEGATDCSGGDHYDSCTDSDTVTEYYCGSSTTFSSANIACGQGYMCSLGACTDCDDDNDGMCESPYDSPADCDDANAAIKYSGTRQCGSGTGMCTTSDIDTACCANSNDCVYNGICYTATTGRCAPWDSYLTVTCSSGAWEYKAYCTATDSGKTCTDYTCVSGTCTGTAHIDSCQDYDTIYYYYISNNVCVGTTMDCSWQCSNGYCIDPPDDFPCRPVYQSCPYLLAWNGRSYDNLGTMLERANSSDAMQLDSINIDYSLIKEDTLDIVIAEIDPETSYIDTIYLEVIGNNKEKALIMPKSEEYGDLLNEIDERYLITHIGDKVRVVFSKIPEYAKYGRVILKIYGYYIQDKEDKISVKYEDNIQNLFRSDKDLSPKILEAFIMPNEIEEGDYLRFGIEINDSEGIKDAIAEIQHDNGIDTINLQFSNGTLTKSYWTGLWNSHDISGNAYSIKLIGYDLNGEFTSGIIEYYGDSAEPGSRIFNENQLWDNFNKENK